MKKKILFVFSVMLFLFAKELNAQLPEVSTSSFPKWYFIQVKGSGDRVNRVFTAEENAVSGRYSNPDLLDQQLWRFEESAGDYVVINKATGKKLDIYYDAVREINHAVLRNIPATTWKIEDMSSGTGYNLTATSVPQENPNAMYAHQANTGGNRDYVVMFETSTWKNALNSEFSFILYDDFYPTESTEENPVWYYIQVQGQSDRADYVFTVEGEQVFGRPLSKSEDFNDIDSQLWRFEKQGDSYIIINKGNNKKLDIAYNSEKDINIGILVDEPSTTWGWEKSVTPGYFNIKIENPLSGRETYIYAHQASNYLSRNFAIIFERVAWKNDINSKFRFLVCEYPTPEISTSDNEVWYNILSKKKGYDSKAITDITQQNEVNRKFSLEDLYEEDYNQQWKIISLSNGEVQFLNRGTNNMIQKEASYNAYYYALAAPYSETASGWAMNYLGDYQYEMFGLNGEGVTVHMNAASDHKDADTYFEGNNRDSGFAWYFKKISSTQQLPQQRATTVTTRIDHKPVDIRIFVVERKIIVEGADDYIVRNISGMQVNQSLELPVGIYLVTVSGKTTKILVQ